MLLFLAAAAGATPAADSAAIDSVAPRRELAGRQLCVGFDILNPIKNATLTNRTGYEFAIDYYLHKELYLAAEFGWGNSDVQYADLKYTSNNTFLRAGFNKVLLPREDSTDWGGILLGLRLATASVHRGPAGYTIIDSLWGNSNGALAAKDFSGYWLEITTGVRVELIKGLMAGWNVRGKFMVNGNTFKDLAPLYIAGYGRGDKNAVFDINFYLSYAIRWKRHTPGIRYSSISGKK